MGAPFQGRKRKPSYSPAGAHCQANEEGEAGARLSGRLVEVEQPEASLRLPEGAGDAASARTSVQPEEDGAAALGEVVVQQQVPVVDGDSRCPAGCLFTQAQSDGGGQRFGGSDAGGNVVGLHVSSLARVGRAFGEGKVANALSVGYRGRPCQ